jgi:predicted TIM-barrel fold metal-dependent hydrolase
MIRSDTTKGPSWFPASSSGAEAGFERGLVDTATDRGGSMTVLDELQQRTFGVEHPDGVRADEVIISADSHVMEPEGLWKREVPKAFREAAPAFGGPRPDDITGPAGVDKHERVAEMAAGSISAEVIFPTWGLKLLALDDPELERVCVRVYNDWIIDYCAVAPDRLIGLAVMSCYDIEAAVKELRRCRDGGLRGLTLWQVPPKGLPFTSDHYDPLWAAAQEMGMPVNIHINTGHGYHKYPELLAASHQTAMKLHQCLNTMHDVIYSGVLERFPELNFVVAENEIGWVPWVLEQWDFTFMKGRTGFRIGSSSEQFYKPAEPMKLLPSEYWQRQVYSTFFNDSVGGRILDWWGADNCMWSSDFPHGDSTWPHSQQVLARDLAELPDEIRAKVVCSNVAELYDFTPPPHINTVNTPL